MVNPPRSAPALCRHFRTDPTSVQLHELNEPIMKSQGSNCKKICATAPGAAWMNFTLLVAKVGEGQCPAGADLEQLANSEEPLAPGQSVVDDLATCVAVNSIRESARVFTHFSMICGKAR